MVRPLLLIVACSAVYGFTVGSVHSWRLAAFDIVKFPLLLLLTGAICSAAYYVFSQFFTRKLTFGDVVRLSLSIFADLSVLLAALAPVCLFLAQTIVRPDASTLNEYPMFLGLNVVFIAACGTAALLRQAVRILRQHDLPLRTCAAVVLVWLAVSLFVGGQCAWYLRPFYGVSTVPAPFMEGTNPDYRGATSFYHAVYHLVVPPPLPRNYTTSNGR